MKSKILIAMDSFKGSLTSLEAGQAVRAGLSNWPQENIQHLPLADGGEGTLEMLDYFFDLKLHEEEIRDLYNKPIKSKIYYSEEIAFLETAHSAGLREERDVFKASSQGLGQELLIASQLKTQKIILGLGGTGVNDGGMGLLHSLGLRFFKGDQLLEPSLDNLLKVNRIEGEIEELLPIIIASDVNNPLLGQRGASAVYGPQKGLKLDEIEIVDRAMENYAGLLEEYFSKKVKDLPGAGAAGGLGFALLLIGAKLEPGFKLLTRLCNFDRYISWADIVITGEGSFDYQSLHGKGPTELARKAKEKNKTVIGLFGSVKEESSLFDSLFSIQAGPVSLEEAIKKATTKKNLERVARSIAGLVKIK